MAKTRIPLQQAEEETRRLREKLDFSTAEIGLTVRTTNISILVAEANIAGGTPNCSTTANEKCNSFSYQTWPIG